MSSPASVQFIVNNSYKPVPRSEQQLDRTGQYRKCHDWTLYVDVVSGNPDLIRCVKFDLPTFQPREYVCSCPVQVKKPNGVKVWRFATRQQSYGATNAKIVIVGVGGTVVTAEHRIQLEDEGRRQKPPVQSLHERRGLNPFRMMPLPDTQKFGIELELTSAVTLSTETIAAHLRPVCSGVTVAESYAEGRQQGTDTDYWKLVPDSSIYCTTNQPNCNKFELVSPVLCGGSGLQCVNKVLKVLANLNLQVNKSMGFHVHVDVSDLSLQQLIKVCQNFIKYEDVLDTFMPPSRRTGSPECDRYFQSNKGSLGRDLHTTNKERNEALAACSDLPSLAYLMNMDGRYYKLNLQNLANGRQPTLEFRQHSATINYSKVAAWTRFCVALVRKSARLAPPSAFKEDRTIDENFDALFMYVIKDRALRDFYRQRQEELASTSGESEHCCSGCASGGQCQAKRQAVDYHYTGFAVLE